MNIAEAQKEIRFHFAGGFYGQLVSSVLWAISASLATFASPTMAIATLVLGGFLIFPFTEGAFRTVIPTAVQRCSMVHCNGTYSFRSPGPNNRAKGTEMNRPPNLGLEPATTAHR